MTYRFSFLLTLFTLLSFSSFSQSSADTKAAVSNHVFILADASGAPTMAYGQAFYMVFHENGAMNMMVGLNMEQAIDGGATKSGSWSTYGSSVSWKWSDGGNGEASYSSSSTHMTAGDVLFMNVGGF